MLMAVARGLCVLSADARGLCVLSAVARGLCVLSAVARGLCVLTVVCCLYRQFWSLMTVCVCLVPVAATFGLCACVWFQLLPQLASVRVFGSSCCHSWPLSI